MHVDGRLLQAHSKLQKLSDLRGIDYLQSGNLYPEIGPDLAGLSALKSKVDEVGPSLYSLQDVHLSVIVRFLICSSNSFHSCLMSTEQHRICGDPAVRLSMILLTKWAVLLDLYHA